MSIFGKIKDAIFGHKKEAAPETVTRSAPVTLPGQAPAGTAPAAPAPAEPVDVEAVLTDRMQEKGNPDLNWRTSIVDLMKLLDLDSSLDNRKQLATELGYTGAKDGSADMNIWLHRRVMTELAKNGGTVPAGLAD